MQSRYIMWLGFAIAAIAYSVVDTIERNRAQREALFARLIPFRNAFRDQYIVEESTERKDSDGS